MARYLILNLAVLAAVALAVLYCRTRILTRPVLVTLAILLLMTAVFDNLIIRGGIVAYDTSRILGVYAGAAPVEDFAYTLAAVCLVPLLWHKMKGRT